MIYTVLVNWNGWRDTIACLGALQAARHHGLTVVVCDNKSGDGSIAELGAWADSRLRRDPAPFPEPGLARLERGTIWQADDAGAPGAAPFRLVLLELDGNLGFAGGNNAGIALALTDPACRYIFILNNDTEVAPDALIALERKLDENPALALCGATLVYHDQPDLVQGLGGTYNPYAARAGRLHAEGSVGALPSEAEIEPRIEFVIGAAIFARPEVLRRTGGLSEQYFLYYEELDLSRRLLPGERMGWARDAVIRHKVGGTIGTGARSARASDLSIYYDHRSKIRYYATYLRRYMPFLMASIARSMLAYTRKGDLRAARVIGLAMHDYVRHDASFRRSFA